MKRTLFLCLITSLLLFAACRRQNVKPPEDTSTQAFTPASTPTGQPQPTSTLNPIQQAIATQGASQKSKAVSARTDITMPEDSLIVRSPDGRIEVSFGLLEAVPYYNIDRDGEPVLLPSRLGFTFLKNPPLNAGLSIVDSKHSTYDETWPQPWGEVKSIRDHHNELWIELSDGASNSRQLAVVFRVFDDGVGFRYEFPEQPYLDEFQIMDEQTEFAMSGDHQAWWIPAFQPNRYEYLYRNTSLGQLSAGGGSFHTPFTMETADGLYLSIHEAALKDYSSMTLKAENNFVFKANLVPWSDGILVRGKTPLKTPWRTIQIADKPGDLITSYLILNLNEPNALGDVSWVKPGKYIGIWWGMHLDKWTWGSGPKHGATTGNTKAYLDFASKHGFSGVLVEGWNLGWDGDWSAHGDQFNFTTPYPDYDLKGLAEYAKNLGVKIIAHNETAAAVGNYESQLEDAYALYQSLGMDTVKTGYVGYGQGVPRYNEQGNLLGMEWHHGQYMVEHHQKVVETAAHYGIMVNAHEPIKDTGLRRTYPNFMTREAARGQEYNAWDGNGGNPPDHVTILPFTRLLAGPMDYTPGILAPFKEYRPNNQVNHTLAKELALYVVIYSPLQMAADLIENYEGNRAFQFILDVPADWEETRVLHSQIGDYITTVRRQRNGEEWFLGSITDENPRELEAALDFLDPGVMYVAEVYSDADGAHWKDNPYAMDIGKYLVDSTTQITLDLAPGGGQAIRFYPASSMEQSSLPAYSP